MKKRGQFETFPSNALEVLWVWFTLVSQWYTIIHTSISQGNTWYRRAYICILQGHAYVSYHRAIHMYHITGPYIWYHWAIHMYHTTGMYYGISQVYTYGTISQGYMVSYHRVIWYHITGLYIWYHRPIHMVLYHFYKLKPPKTLPIIFKVMLVLIHIISYDHYRPKKWFAQIF